MRGLLVLAMTAALTAQAAAATPDDVIAAERAFAADGQKLGWIAAFKRHAAADAIVFRDAPINAQQSLADQPDEPADRSLKWWPIFAGVAQSGELGFTTGPFTVGDKGFGHYFTVWAKQRDGSWRWIFDGGPRNAAKSPFGPETTPLHLPLATAAAGSAERAWSDVGAAEAALAKAAATNAQAAYAPFLSNDARVMGSPEQPATTAEARRAELGRRAAAITFRQLGGLASQAGDLAFTYGAASWSRDGQERRGHYARIWQKRAEGWVLVFDEILLVPPARPAQ